jgi:preprotein translocase subunit SecG
MNNFWLISQAVLSVLIITAVLLQTQGGGIGPAFGGSTNSYHTKRGLEKVIFNATIVLIILFAIASISSLVTK